MTQQEIRLELIKLINIAPEELLLAEEFIKGEDKAADEIADIRKRGWKPTPIKLILASETARVYDLHL